jgi:hypothetical protein
MRLQRLLRSAFAVAISRRRRANRAGSASAESLKTSIDARRVVRESVIHCRVAAGVKTIGRMLHYRIVR